MHGQCPRGHAYSILIHNWSHGGKRCGVLEMQQWIVDKVRKRLFFDWGGLGASVREHNVLILEQRLLCQHKLLIPYNPVCKNTLSTLHNALLYNVYAVRTIMASRRMDALWVGEGDFLHTTSIPLIIHST